MRRLVLAACAALVSVGALVATGEGAHARPRAAASGRALVVTKVTPARGQQTLGDLSDPGINNRITVRFSAPVEAADVIDEQDPANGLSAQCDLRDHTFAVVPASAFLRRNVLSIDPFSASRPLLPAGRYTLTLSATIRSTGGRRLNAGAADFTTSFTVGSEAYPPVLRGTSPAAGEDGVALRRAVVLSFDSPIDRDAASLAVRVEDRSTDPPTPVGARVRVARHGYDVVVTPDGRRGFPPSTDLTLVVAGRGSATDPPAHLLTGADGADFTRDPSPRWVADPLVPTLFHSPIGDFDDLTGEFSMTFRTRDPAAAVLR